MHVDTCTWCLGARPSNNHKWNGCQGVVGDLPTIHVVAGAAMHRGNLHSWSISSGGWVATWINIVYADALLHLTQVFNQKSPHGMVGEM